MSLVLLVEDVEDNRELARFLLENEGYRVIEAHDGAEAVAIARAQMPDLVLMDLSLPVMDGWEAAGMLKADPATAHLPIIAVTAHAMAGDQDRVLEAGFDGYIAKPLEVGSFGPQVRSYLERRRA